MKHNRPFGVLLFFLLPLVLVSVLVFCMPSNSLAMPARQGNGPSYLVQAGDSFSSIASRFGLTLQELIDANPDVDPNTLAVGAQIKIPGLQNIEGLLITDDVQFGDSLTSISRRNQIDPAFLIKLNHITSPSEMFAGLGVILPQEQGQKPLTNRVLLHKSESILEAAARSGNAPIALLQINQLSYSWQALPSDVLFDQVNKPDSAQSALPFSIQRLIIKPIPMLQGGTTEIIAYTDAGTTITGKLDDMELHFFTADDGSQVALQGVHAMITPGPHPLRIDATAADGTVSSFEQMVIVNSGHYPEDPILNVDPQTIDPAITDAEYNQILAIVNQVTPQKYWAGMFASPSYYNDCFTSRYGNRRTYVGIGTDLTLNSFHSGLDFCGGTGLPVTAPADGVVVFAGPLNVRGNATIIDHGWGIYSGIWHQDSIAVQVGQTVKKGDPIGTVGGTGRVTGAHLHWEVWVNGVQVNPMEWLDTEFP